MTELHRELWNAGFAIWQTGGGCEAYGLQLTSSHYCLVTDTDGGTIDIDGGDWLLGTYTDDGEQVDTLYGTGAVALAAALADVRYRYSPEARA